MNKTIFVIDDDTIHQKIVEIKLRKQGFNGVIKGYLDAEDALTYLTMNAALLEKIPDIILLDINMPVMDGWDFIRAYNKLQDMIQKEVKIFIVTSSVDNRDREQANTYDCICGYIIKPIDDKLLQLIF